jgi:drug/metabolite transporter (DMT)-like permease
MAHGDRLLHTPAVAVLLALISALTYGTGDFFGGMAARRVHPIAVGWLSHVLVVVPIIVLAVIVGADAVSARDALWGAGGGLIGALALVGLYVSLSRGPMSIVAPITALVSVVIPVMVGALDGERPSLAQWAGIGTATVAIVLISTAPPSPAHPGAGPTRPSPTTLVAAGLAGTGFGLFFVALDRASDGSGLWPLAFGRMASSGAFSVLLLVSVAWRRRVFVPELRSAWPLIAGAAAFDLVANAFYLAATRRGLLSVVAVMTSMYPASTVLLASRVLQERIARSQLIGMGLALLAVTLVAAG